MHMKSSWTRWVDCMGIQCYQENQRQVRCIQTFEERIRKDIVLSKGYFHVFPNEADLGLRHIHRKCVWA